MTASNTVRDQLVHGCSRRVGPLIEGTIQPVGAGLGDRFTLPPRFARRRSWPETNGTVSTQTAGHFARAADGWDSAGVPGQKARVSLHVRTRARRRRSRWREVGTYHQSRRPGRTPEPTPSSSPSAPDDFHCELRAFTLKRCETPQLGIRWGALVARPLDVTARHRFADAGMMARGLPPSPDAATAGSPNPHFTPAG